MRILVVSDLHAHQKEPTSTEAPSYFSALPRFSGENWNPIASIPNIGELQEHRVDWILCPGDYGDRNDAIAQHFAWKQLNKLKTTLRARRLVGAIGNHDVDSRRNTPDNPADQELRSLAPAFPIADRRIGDRFWRDNMLVHQFRQQDCTLVVLNSCTFHSTYGPEDDVWSTTEYLRGRIAANAIETLQNTVPQKLSKFNVLLLHHHLRRQAWMEEDNSELQNGEAIVDVLKATGRRWLVVHGHQHIPKIDYADAQPNSPVVLSAGSIAAKSYAVSGWHPRNQIHLVTMKDPGEGLDASSLYGTVKTWNWSPGTNWVPAQHDSGLPYRCGFGAPGGLPQLADRIVSKLSATTTRFCRWADLSTSCPEINFIVPAEQTELLRLLRLRGARIPEDTYWPEFIELEGP